MIKLNENQKNLGVMKVNTTRNFTVGLTNEGSDTVNLQSIKVGCGSCTTASLSNVKIAPKESTLLNVNYSPKATGQNVPKTVSVTFIDNGKPETVIFTFFATVV